MTVINTNVKAIVAQDSMRSVNLKLATAMERLSTGLRINSAKDDAAGLAISERMNAQVRGFGMAIKNANDGLSMAQTADGAYGEVTSMLQRMRELAVQAANGAMGPLDRRSLQLEIEELKTEIENVATKTHFNNITLLDGTAKNVNLQIGANQGDTMEIGFDSARIKDIGSGLRPALTSLGGNADAFDKLEAGDLVLNGVLVPASIAPDDNLSFSGETLEANKAIEIAASAIAKAAAINKTTEQSNVYALVNETLVQGNIMTAPAAATSAANVLINGIATRDLALTTDNEINRVALVTAINDISSQTGVRAINTGSDANGITLVADDGRNITVQFSAADFTAANTGISGSTTAVTYVGSYSLYSTRGEPITVEQQIGRDITGSGLQIGVFQPDMATTVTFERSGAGVVDDGGTDGARVPLGNGETPSIDNVGVLNGATLVINDITIDAARATDDSASHTASDVTASAKSASAIATAAAINKKSDLHGVTAVAEPNVIRSEEEQSFTAGSTGSINLQGVAISVSTFSRNAVLETINAYSGQTGVVARAYGEGMELVAEDGRNIVIAIDSSTITAANLGLANVTLGTGTDDSNGVVFYSSVRLTSEKEFTVARGGEGGANFQKLGFREGTFGGTNTGTKIADVDVSSQAGAQEAITAIDAALEDVSAAQARSGAYQNRLDAVINVLSESTENITASRSRILDADYALEATNMAKAQIISQAANAMLAQANQSQQSVLQLLQ